MNLRDEFYIGWMPKAPDRLKDFLRKYLLVLLLFVIALGAVLALQQKKLSTAKFEFGKLTSVKGIYSATPVPHLLVRDKNDFMMVPLVGYGKHGAEGIMQELSRNGALEGKEIELKGSLLYGDGKLLMQVDKNDAPLVQVSTPQNFTRANETSKGELSLKGEIIDPKCYFGVMKPGEGKVHKDCAIRCILGGIPPVLAVTNEKGEKQYVLLKGTNGENINEQVKNLIATPVQITGRAFQYYNWAVLHVNHLTEVAAVKNEENKALVISCGPSSCCKQL